MARHALAALLAAALALPGCRSSGATELEALYEENLADDGQGGGEALRKAESRRVARIARVRLLTADPQALSLEERLFGAAVLLDSSDLSDLGLAEDLALSAAEAGDDRGFPLAAEAIDRQCLVLGQPQRYGTQYIWSPETQRWSLYSTDPATTDAERRAMGLASLSEARALAADL